MKLGLITSIFEKYNLEQVLNFACKNGLECLEIACWPNGKAERRYAGTSHIDVENLDKAEANRILALCRDKGVEISALAYYPNTMDSNLEKRKAAIDHLYAVIDASAMLDVNLVTTFIGRDQRKTVEENLELFSQIWPPIISYAENKGVRIAIENCPMLFGPDQWPGGQNLFTTPVLWKKMFDIIPNTNFGINYDPSHFIWQMIDYIQPIYEFNDRIFHVHIKDIKLYPEKLHRVGVMAYPLDFMAPKLPGLGDVDWGAYISALKDIGYDGYICLEIEDRAFEDSLDSIEKSIILAARYMRQFVI